MTPGRPRARAHAPEEEDRVERRHRKRMRARLDDAVGELALQTVEEASRVRYRRAMRRFHDFCAQTDWFPRTIDGVDRQAARFAAHCAERGEPRNWAVEVRVALQKFLGLARGRLGLAASVHAGLVKGDVRRELRPIGHSLLEIVAGLLLLEESRLCQAVALGAIVMYGGVLRGAELLKLTPADIGPLTLTDAGALRAVTLRRTKTIAYRQRRERNLRLDHEQAAVHGRVENLALEELRRRAVARNGVDERLVPVTKRQWTDLIASAIARTCTALHLAPEGLRPHGIRAGAATDLAVDGLALPAVMAAGRWTTAASASRYVDRADAQRSTRAARVTRSSVVAAARRALAEWTERARREHAEEISVVLQPVGP